MIFLLILMGYAVIKVFFANLKRGGILLIQIAVGSLYLFSVPRGYIDGFVGWCKQVIGLCLTAFLQATVLIAGLMVVKDQALLGLGLMLSAGEIPRIAGQINVEEGEEYNTYVVTGSFVDRLLASVNIHDADSLRYFHKVLNNKGVLQQIRDMGVQDGDMVRLNDFEFEYIL